MAGFPELQDQLLLRLRDDIHTLTPATTVELLRTMSDGPPTRTYLDVIDRLWRHVVDGESRKNPGARQMIAALVKAVLRTSSDTDLSRLSSDLLVALRTGNERNVA